MHMRTFRAVAILSIFVLACTSAGFAAKYKGSAEKAPTPSGKTAANCVPATAATELDINNTRALIQAGGDMWWDLVGIPQYEIPQGSGRTALFAGSLWLGGQDVSGQLKVAAQRFRGNGNDFWTGPLSTLTAEIEPQTCIDYDKHYVTTRNEVLQFVGWYEAGLVDAEDGTSTQQEEYPGYSVPEILLDWPAHGRNFDPYNEDFYLAPFFDRNGDGVYNVQDGDYPGYDLKGEIDCSERIVNIYGDQNLWWVFNDKGNVHTETGSNAIGMEIRAQAFAFATNDEVNNMTFYNYELINRSTFTLTQTYFAQWVDADLGNAQDDYVGCDVRRGLGYCYNGDENDEDNGGAIGYGSQPPAIGVDFFQGPFQDNDGLDNPLTGDYDLAIAENGIPYAGIGIGYGDGVIDNERFGMRKFLYHNNNNGVRGDPETGVQYYNLKRAIWRDGTPMKYGGTGHIGDPDADPNVNADYMFPDDTDPIGWGTGGVPQPEWNEVNSGNTPDDRRFMQSAGPFTLQPGALNNITVGVVWAQATTGGAAASVQTLRKADDKTQALFDNCFKVLNGPDAPDLTFQELDRELIIYLNNSRLSNNYNEEYTEKDPFQVPPDSLNGEPLTSAEKDAYNTYTFQGYQIYQVSDNSVSANDLDDPEKARLIAQSDIRDGVGQIVNYYFDEDLNGNIPVEEVDGDDEGVVHSFTVTEDQFASGDKTLVNHKTYYFMAIAYAYNNFKTYDPNDANALDGQTTSYLASRKSATGGIRSVAAIPHRTDVESGGTVLNSAYGDGVALTRVEGIGNGGNWLEMSVEDREMALVAPEYRVKNPTYLAGNAPVNIKVIDPLAVVGGDWTLAFTDTTSDNGDDTLYGYIANASWILYNDANEVYEASNVIRSNNEQLIPELGISIQPIQVDPPGTDAERELGSGIIGASVEFADNDKQWLAGVPDGDGQSSQNWIRSGTQQFNTTDPDPYDDYFYALNGDNVYIDPNQDFEALLGGTWAPAELVSTIDNSPFPETPARSTAIYQYLVNTSFPHIRYPWLQFLHSVDIVMTDDQSKWTRCPVLEAQDTIPLSANDDLKGRIRSAQSVDKAGNPADAGSGASSNPNDANYISETGMGWFPGYAVDIETGERLNMAFAEDSWLEKDNGNDMQWNPTSNFAEGVGFENPQSGIPIDWRLGGKHFVYVFRNNVVEDNLIDQGLPMDYNDPTFRMPAYDAGQFALDKLVTGNEDDLRDVYRACMWVGFPMVVPGEEFLSTETVVKLRVQHPYERYGTGEFLSEGATLTVGQRYLVDKGPIVHDGERYERGQSFVASVNGFTIGVTNTQQAFSVDTEDSQNVLVVADNGGLPLYNFNLDALAASSDEATVAEDMLGEINVVPNPYYAYSQYETDKLDTRVKVINLPQTCTISIYTTDGILVRRYEKDDPTVTSIDWDLKNQDRVPVASGAYLIHVNVPNVGERVLKWFGVLRPVDLDSF